ncbi:MAG: HEAT repeat domain-containing protein [Myxococcales bacterium]|nr:HEAT repeat domain-containing protein [Myxococcales bacterium]
MSREELLGDALLHVRPLDPSATAIALNQRGLRVQRVELDGVDAPWSVEGAWLRVEAPAGAEHDLRVVYRTTGEGAVRFRRGRGEEEPLRIWALSSWENARAWFPTWDHPSERFTVRTTLIAPRELGAWGIGRRAGQRELDGGRLATTWTLDHPVPAYLVAFLVGALEERPLGPGVWEVVPRGGEAPLHDTLTRTPADLAALEQLLDEPYPWGELRIAPITAFPVSGMENPGLIMVADHLGGPEARTVLTHELAHQWLGDRVGPGRWHDLWLSEGLATWAEHRVTERSDPIAAADDLRNAAAPTLETTPLAPRDGDLSRFWVQENVYVDGLAAMHALGALLGRDAVDRALAAHVDRAGQATTDDLRARLEEAAGRSLEAWFDAWIRGPRPTIHSRWWWEAGERIVEVTWEGGGVPVEVGVEIDGVRAGTVALAPGTTRWSEPAEAAPRYVRVDPDGILLGATWKREQSAEAWTAQLERSSTVGRFEAIEALADAKVAAPLARTVEHASAPSEIRRLAAYALGTFESPEQLRTFAAQLRDDRTPELRRVVARVIHQPDVVPDLRTLALREGDPELSASALHSLAWIDGDEAARVARKALERDADVVRDAAVWALGITGEPTDLDTVLAHVDPGKEPVVFFEALTASKRLVQRGAPAERLQTVLIRLASATDPTFRGPVLDALGRVGDRDALATLQRVAESTTLPWMAERATKAAKAIEKRHP